MSWPNGPGVARNTNKRYLRSFPFIFFMKILGFTHVQKAGQIKRQSEPAWSVLQKSWLIWKNWAMNIFLMKRVKCWLWYQWPLMKWYDLLQCILMFGLWTLQPVSCFVWIHLFYVFMHNVRGSINYFLTPHIQNTSQQSSVRSGDAFSLPPTSTKHSHSTLPISMLQTAPPCHSIKLASFINQAHFPVKVSFINVSHMGFDSGLSIPQYGAFLLAADKCLLWCHHCYCWRLPPRTSLIV